MWYNNLIGEIGEIPPTPTKTNTVIISKYNGVALWIDSTFELNPIKAIIFPNDQLAKGFIDNYSSKIHDYKEAMIKDNYVFHIVNLNSKCNGKYYADQMYMTIDYKSN